jgi:hypothetical protein
MEGPSVSIKVDCTQRTCAMAGTFMISVHFFTQEHGKGLVYATEVSPRMPSGNECKIQYKLYMGHQEDYSAGISVRHAELSNG